MPKCKYCGKKINLFERYFGTYGKYCSQRCLEKEQQKLEKEFDKFSKNMSSSQIEEMKKRLGL